VSYEPTPAQRPVIDAGDPVLLVTGGAGTGKTTTAAAAVRACLERTSGADWGGAPGRALFLSFSRAAVAQILDRTADILGPCQGRVQITTYHAFAWSLIERFGSAVGLPDPVLATESEVKLLGPDGTVRYRDLMPLALRLCAVPAIAAHLQARWSVIVCDEFQDTDDGQWRLLLAIRGPARLLLLGDPNQCIYSNLPGAVGVGPQRLAAVRALPGAREIALPEASHRDPTEVLPAAAAAIRARDFGHDAVTAALTSGRLQIRASLEPAQEAAVVSELVHDLRGEGHTVGVFSHHIDSTTALSDELLQLGVDHEIVGLPESVTAALDTQHTMIAFAAGTTGWEPARSRLAVFITSTERGSRAPELAQMILGTRSLPQGLAARLEQLRTALADSASLIDAADIAARAHAMLGFTRGGRQWHRAAKLLRPLVARTARRASGSSAALGLLDRAVTRQQAGLLTYAADADPVPVQLMGLYQTKGREADATVVVLRSNDYYGTERTPFPVGSRLLYVVLTRARHETIILLFGHEPPPLVAPLAQLAASQHDKPTVPDTCPARTPVSTFSLVRRV
jgi:DNA helicase-2/ATP-dependent DNA helicase PcrA